MVFLFSLITFFLEMNFGFNSKVYAHTYSYPQVRYVSSVSESMSGVILPMGDEVGNAIMNNPAALAKYAGYRSEPLNLNFIANSGIVSNLTSTLGNTFSLGGLSSSLNSNANSEFGLGFSNMTAFSWNGFGLGILLQEHSRATSDGTNVNYYVVSQLIPSVGYGFGMARNLIRVGYSLQFVNQTSGPASGVSDSSAKFLSGLQKGTGLSHNVSLNFAFPVTYLPTFSFIARNLGGLHFTSGGILPRGSNITGVPSSEQMTVDAAFDFMVRISGNFKSHWYFEYKDFTKKSNFSTSFERLSTGLDLSVSPNVSFRGGMTGIAEFSTGISYRSDHSEIALAYYKEKTPFSTTPSWDSKFALQYKITLNQKSKKVENDSQSVESK